MENNRLVLIDGHAILHRAYHALPPLTNKTGQPTNAVYGFMTMLLKVLDDLKPTHLIVCFDLPQPTFRQQQYTAYQGKRPEMEGNLKDQIVLIHELLDALKIPYFEVPGYEADDCIGTLSRLAAQTVLVRSDKFGKSENQHNQSVSKSDALVHRFSEHLDPLNLSDLPESDQTEVYIVTGDRDMLQLINEHVKVYVPVKGLSETKTYDAKLIEEEFGVMPSQWVDVKALKGDSSDNYAGVPGIGPKTAQKLIAEFDSLENLYKNLGKLDKTVATKLAEGAESAGLAKKLATIEIDVPLKLELEKALVEKFNWQSGVDYMTKNLGFKSLVQRIEKVYLGKEPTPKSPPESDSQLKLI